MSVCKRVLDVVVIPLALSNVMPCAVAALKIDGSSGCTSHTNPCAVPTILFETSGAAQKQPRALTVRMWLVVAPTGQRSATPEPTQYLPSGHERHCCDAICRNSPRAQVCTMCPREQRCPRGHSIFIPHVWSTTDRHVRKKIPNS